MLWPILLLLAAAAPPCLAVAAIRAGRIRARREAEAEANARRLAEPGGFARWLHAARERARLTVVPIESARDRHDRVARRFEVTARSIREVLPGEPGKSLAWVAAAAAGLTLLWGISFANEVHIDAGSFAGLGHGHALAWSLALLVSIGFSLVGLVIFELLGFTRVLPRLERLRKPVRYALIVEVLLVFVLAASQLPRLAEYRSEPIAARVRQLEQAAAVTARPGANPLLVQDVNRNLSAEQARLDASRFADRRVVVVAAVVEAATSWAVIWLALLLGFWMSKLVSARAQRRANSANDEIRVIEQRFLAEAADVAERLRIAPGQLRVLLEEAGGQVPPRQLPEPSPGAVAGGGEADDPPEDPPPAAEEPVVPPTPPAAGPPAAAPPSGQTENTHGGWAAF
jgi:hypothetical protein